MGTLSFDGASDRAQFSGVSATLQNIATGAWTIAAVFNKLSPAGTWDMLFGFWTDGAPAGGVDDRLWLEVQSATGSGRYLTLGNSGEGSNADYGAGNIANTTPYLAVCSKAAGSALPQTSLKNLSSGTWAHAAGNVNMTDRSVLTSFGIVLCGMWTLTSGDDDFQGHLGVIAAWQGVNMDQTQRIACGTNNRTSDLYNHSVGTPHLLTELTSTAPTDLVGGWTTIDAVTATLDGAETLQWTFDGVGAPPFTAEAFVARVPQVGGASFAPGLRGPGTDRVGDMR